MSIEYHDPRAEPLIAPEPYDLEADLTGPVTIGLLANGFPDSVAFLDAVETALATALPGAGFRRYDKGNASVPASDALVAAIVSQCGAVVSAYGH